MRITRRSVVFGLPCLALAQCAAAPARYYRLAVIPGTPVPTPPMTVNLRGITIPGYLVQNNIAGPGAGDQLNALPNDLWAESLADLLQTTMVLDLSQRLPDATIIASGAAVSATPDLLVELNLLRFDPDNNGNIDLVAQLALKSGAHRTLQASKTISLTAAAGADAPSIVTAMSALWAMAAGQIAEDIAG